MKALSFVLQSFLAEHGFADPAARIAGEVTPLMQAARYARCELVEELLALGAAINMRNADGNHALWLACFAGDEEVVRCLLAAGAAVDNRNDSGTTCLMYVASAGKAHLLPILLAAGADPQLRNDDDFTALDLVASIDCLRILRAEGKAPAGTRAVQ
jgi:uncharacterized protein